MLPEMFTTAQRSRISTVFIAGKLKLPIGTGSPSQSTSRRARSHKLGTRIML